MKKKKVAKKKPTKQKLILKSTTTLNEIKSKIKTKTQYASQVIPNQNGYTLYEKKGDLIALKKIVGKNCYVGREGLELFPHGVFMFKEVKPPENFPTEPGCIWVQNVDNPRAKYKITQETLQLETEFLFPLIKGPNIKCFEYEQDGILALFPYDNNDHTRPIDRIELGNRAPKTLEWFLKHEETLDAQSSYSDRIRGHAGGGGDVGEFYGVARVGLYTFAPFHVAYRDNTKLNACVISSLSTPFGDKLAILQNHAPSICEDEDEDDNFIDESEAHYICAIINSSSGTTFIKNSSDSQTFPIRLPIKIPKYDPNNQTHTKLEQLSRNIHEDRTTLNQNLKKIDKILSK